MAESDVEKRAETIDIANRMLEDRRSVRFETMDGPWTDIEVAASALHPGYLAVWVQGSLSVIPPERVAELITLASAVAAGSVVYPDEPRPCWECDQVVHSPGCPLAKSDRTIIPQTGSDRAIDTDGA